MHIGLLNNVMDAGTLEKQNEEQLAALESAQAETEGQIDALLTGIEGALEHIEQADLLKSRLEDGPDEAMLYFIATSGQYTEFISPENMTVPDENNMQQVVEAMLEDIGDAAQKGWEALKKFFQKLIKMIEQLLDFITKKIFNKRNECDKELKRLDGLKKGQVDNSVFNEQISYFYLIIAIDRKKETVLKVDDKKEDYHRLDNITYYLNKWLEEADVVDDIRRESAKLGGNASLTELVRRGSGREQRTLRTAGVDSVDAAQELMKGSMQLLDHIPEFEEQLKQQKKQAEISLDGLKEKMGDQEAQREMQERRVQMSAATKGLAHLTQLIHEVVDNNLNAVRLIE